MVNDIPLIYLPMASMVVAFAYLVRGVTGFGSGLVAVPLLAIVLPLSMVVPVIALLDFVASLVHGMGSRKIIQWKEILLILPFSIFGIISSVFVLKYVDGVVLQKLLGLFVVLYALSSFRSTKGKRRISRLWAIPWGGLGGMVNSLFGTGGPFYVIYLKLRNLSNIELRATVATILLIDGFSRLVGYTTAGFFTPTALILFLTCIPVGGLALYVGGHIHLKLDQKVFQWLIGGLLLLSGSILLAS